MHNPALKLSSNPWQEFKDDLGRAYYYNKETKESVWSVPPEFVNPKVVPPAAAAQKAQEEAAAAQKKVHAVWPAALFPCAFRSSET